MSNRTFTWIVLGMLTASLLGAALLIDAALDILNGLDSGLLSASSLEGVAMFRHLVETQLLLPTLVLMGFTVFGIVLFLYIRQMHGDALVESQQASASLQVQEGYLRALFDNANALIYIKDLDGRYLRVNHGYERLFNIQSQSIIGKTVFDLFPQPTAEAVAAANRRAIESGKNVVSEHNAALPDGLHTLLVNQFPIRDEAGRIYALGGISTDVTDFRRVEAELRIRDQAMEASTSAILILDAQQPELPAIYVNPAFETITGYSRTEALGKNPRYLHGDDRDQSGLTSLREAVRTGQDCKVLLRNYRKSGEMYWNELCVSPVRDPDGRLTHYVGIQNDVTSRIEAVQELHDNWEFISTMMKLIPEGIYVFDIQHFVNIYNNQAAERLLGYSFNEFHAMGADAVARLLHPDEQARVLDEIQRLGMLKDGETLRSERRLLHKDGQYCRIECHETVIERTADGLPRRILGIASDVTERRRVEEQLRESQAMVERITRLMPDGVFLYNLKQEYLYNNNRFAEMLGYAPEEMEAMGNRLERVAHLAHPDDLTKTIDYGQRMQILADGREAQTTLRMRHKDGSWRWFNFREVVVSRLEDGTPDQVLGLATDITEQQLAEEAARASTQMLERITQTIPDHVYIHDVITQSVLYENETLGKLLGYSADEFAALGSTTNIALALVHPDDLSFVIQKHLSLGELADSDVCDYSYRLRHKDGSWRWLYVRESVFARSEDGVVTQIVGIAQDITARKAAEAEVIESRRLVDQVANLVPECLYILDLFDMNIIYQNDGYARLLGYPVEMLRGGWQIILEIVHPDDAPALADNVARLHQAPAQSIVESEYRVRHSGGQWRWINAREIVLTRDESGLPRLILGSAADVTERKEAVEKLRQREERYRVISEVSSDYAYFHKVHPDGRIEAQWITEGFERVLGLEEQLDAETKLNGRSYFEQHVLHPDDRPTREADLQWVLQGETVYSEYRIFVDGEIRWLSIHRKPEIDPETGRVSGYYGVVRDITDRKQAEEALRASEDRYRRLFASNPQPMWVYDLETMVFLDVNDAAVQQYGYTRNEFLSMTLRDLRPTEEGKRLIPAVGTFDPPNAWRHRRKDGSLIDVEVSAHELVYEGHRARMSLVHDISARVAAEEARQQSELRYRDLWAASQRQAQELSLIAQVRNVTVSELDLKPLASKVVEVVAETFGYALVSLYMISGDQLSLVYQTGYDHTRESIVQSLPIGRGIMGRAARTGEAVFLKDVTAEPEFIGVFEGITSEICVPLMDQGRVVGVFNVESTYASGLTDDDFRIVSTLGEYISIAIGRARLYTDLRNSEERFRQIADTIVQVFWIYDVRESAFTYISPACEPIWKLRPEDIYARQDLFMERVHPDDIDRVASAMVHFLNMIEPKQIEFRIVWPDGHIRWLSIRMYPAGGIADTRQRIIGLTDDITERKQIEQAEHEQRVLAESFRDIAETLSRTLDLDEVLDLIMETMGQVIPMDSASLMLEEGGKVRVVRGHGYDPSAQDYLINHVFDLEDLPIFKHVQESGEWRIVADVDEEVDWTQFEAPIDIRSYMGVPIIVEEKVVGLINADSRTPGFFTAEHAEKLKSFATQAAIAIQNARLYTELRNSEQRFREIAQTIRQVFWVYDLTKGKFTYVSPSVNTIYQFTPEEVYADSMIWTKPLHPEDMDPMSLAVMTLPDLAEPLQSELRIVWPDGSLRWLNAHMYPAGGLDGTPKRIIGLTEDITERKRIEQAEREQRVLAESFRDIAETLSRTLDLDEVLDLIMETLGRVVPADSASLMLEERGKIRVVRDRGLDDAAHEYLKGHVFDLKDIPNFVRMRETHDWMIIDDVSQSPSWTEFEVPLPVRSYLGVPIIVENQVVGVLNADSRTTGFFTPDHAQNMETFAAQAAIAIQNARLYKQAQELATIEERQRLARELHDAVSQTLFSASVIAETLPRIYQRQSPADMQRGLQELNRLTRGAMAEMRTLLAELRPRALLDGDLPTLVKQLADAAAGHVEADFMVELPPRCVLPAEVKLAFYRIAQEALSNIVKHSRARTVQVRMVRADDAAWLEIADDGRGFDPQQLVSGHYGLQIMRERAEAIGAHLEMHSEPGQGTQIHLHWREAVIEAI